MVDCHSSSGSQRTWWPRTLAEDEDEEEEEEMAKEGVDDPLHYCEASVLLGEIGENKFTSPCGWWLDEVVSMVIVFNWKWLCFEFV